MDVEKIVGIGAGVFTTIAVLPQIYKAWTTKQVDDISAPTFMCLLLGVGLWTVYGFMKQDLPIIITNGLSFIFNGSLLFLLFTNKGNQKD